MEINKEIKDYKAICQEILEEDALNRLWNNYAKENGITFEMINGLRLKIEGVK